MPFPTLGSAGLWFAGEELVWRTYPAQTTKRVELFNVKGFAAAALGANDEAFVVNVASILGSVSEAKNVPPAHQAQLPR